MYSILAGATLLAALATAKSTPGPGDMNCPSGVHVIVSRASQEAPGPGIMGQVASKVLERIPGSDMESLDYPALLDPYVPSQTAGVANLTKLIQQYSEKCPRTKMVLMGYSQGAHVTSDVLCGTSETGFPATKPQRSTVTDKIAAVVLMGDPSFTAGQPFNVGTSHGSGMFPRLNPDGCKCVDHKMMSICDAGDMFCEEGGNSLAVHMSYVINWGDAAVDFVLSMIHSY
ncbi:cutinase [Ilyonectria destructans]|nr:cutinase [Ilyonectria destructans]